MKKRLVSFVVGIAILTPWISSPAQRETVPLHDGWKFIRQDVAQDAAVDSWESIGVPHTWNAKDGQTGKKANPDQPAGYYRGPGWYARELDIPAAWKGRRVFIRFEAASLVADVYLNGQHVGQHRGGFAAFCYELTPLVDFSGKNLLRVKVDNSKFEDVPPLSGDFTVDGGIYRPVGLIATDSTCITPLDYATSGVYLTQKSMDAQKAVVEVETKVSNTLTSAAPVTVQIDLANDTKQPLQTIRVDSKIDPAGTQSVKQTLTIPNPHPWNGRLDPYLYHVHVKVLRDGKTVDEVDENLGLRTVAIDQARKFLLNGKPYPIYGVNRHQELVDKGWALSPADHEADAQIILDMGTTAVRLAHYQQSDYFHDLCDRNGLLLWQEIPLVERVNGSDEFNANARQQLTEMIMQGYNHPSLALWGIYNELGASWNKEKGAPPEPLLQTLHDLAKKLDPSRPVVAASQSTNHMPMHAIPDWQAFNIYPGWYWGKPADFAATIEKGVKELEGKITAISEYGAGANITQHDEGEVKQPKAGSQHHPEEWQAHLHESEWAQAKDNEHLWGTFVWAMFDFASAGRNEGGTPGINDKGLVTHDHKVKKDTYYFYQANWAAKPMVYIASRRMTPRKLAVTDVKIYSNCPQVELRVNGKSQSNVSPDGVHVFLWSNIMLQPGKNVIEAVAIQDKQKVTDSCEWVLE